MDNQNEKHQRRVHYSGRYPRQFNEKYKELNPDKYADTVEKVKSKGSTPAGMHISIMVQEILDFLKVEPGKRGLDATLGYGGHTQEMLKCLNGNGHIYALDIDTAEMQKTKDRLQAAGYGEDILSVRHINFADIDEVSREAGKFDFILADLGVSSMQIDNPERGFSYKVDGPLDLRMDRDKGVPAYKRLQELTQDEFEGMLIENSDEPYADKIAKAVFARLRKKEDISTTAGLRRIIEETLAFVPAAERRETVKKTCQRVFQALRIDVNSEFESLESFLKKLPDVCAPGARIAILTFHSGEDRLVKQYFKDGYRDGLYSEIAQDVVRPSKEECIRNSRAHSTKLRWAVRSGERS